MTKTQPTAPIVFEPEFIEGLKQIFDDNIPFNQVLGLKIISLAPERVIGRIDMKHDDLKARAGEVRLFLKKLA